MAPRFPTRPRSGRASHFGEETPPAPAAPTRRRQGDPAPSDALVQAFVLRTGRALTRIAERMPRDRLLAAVGASTDTDVLFRSLREAAAIGAEILPDKPDPLTEAFLG